MNLNFMNIKNFVENIIMICCAYLQIKNNIYNIYTLINNTKEIKFYIN
jgi:hypothetical protein